MTPFSDLWAQARSFWQEAGGSTRAAIAGGGIFLLVLAVGFTFWAASPDFVSVFAGTPSEAQSLAKEMDKAAIPYRISPDGGSLSVRAADAGRARQLAGGVAGASESRRGLPGISSMGPFATYEQQRALIERAQEEAIEQELGRYAGVQKAGVNLALPVENARVGEDVPPKAAVTLTPVPGGTFDEGQVAAMAYVVANSVPGLTPENVTIASSEGATLWAGAESVTGVSGNGTLKTRTRAEKEYVRSRQAELQGNLDRVFGPRKAIVYVDATLDLDRQETESKKVVPAGEDGKGLMVSEESQSEQYSGAAGGAAGGGAPVGMDANRAGGGVPTYPAATGAERGAGSYKQTRETINYDNSTENVHTVKAVGEPKRLNVSVWVDDKLPANVRAAIETWVRGSVINPTNAQSTTVAVVSAPFDRTGETLSRAARETSERQAWLAAYAPYIVLPLCLAAMLIAAFLLTRRKGGVSVLAAPGSTSAEFALAGGGVGFARGAAVPAPGTRIGDILPIEAEPGAAHGPRETEEEEPEEAPRMRPIREKAEPELEAILDFIDKRPETAALLLRSWTTVESSTRARG